MAIKREIWKEEFTLKELPEWQCPACNKEMLHLDKVNFTVREDSHSKKSRSHEDWDSLWITGVFNGLLECKNKKCEETVVLLGKMFNRWGEVFIDEEHGWEQIEFESLAPKLFIPALHIFPLSNNVPERIKKQVIEAFSLYWVDTSACANKIRVVVESIMNDYKVKRTSIKNQKRHKLVLHKRIETFTNKYPEAGKLLMAVKWIGNHGSHSIEPMNKEDILDGFEILEHVFHKIYDTDTVRISKLSTKIINRKGPIARNS
jgi:hypothetical protein